MTVIYEGPGIKGNFYDPGIYSKRCAWQPNKLGDSESQDLDMKMSSIVPGLPSTTNKGRMNQIHKYAY